MSQKIWLIQENKRRFVIKTIKQQIFMTSKKPCFDPACAAAPRHPELELFKATSCASCESEKEKLSWKRRKDPLSALSWRIGTRRTRQDRGTSKLMARYSEQEKCEWLKSGAEARAKGGGRGWRGRERWGWGDDAGAQMTSSSFVTVFPDTLTAARARPKDRTSDTGANGGTLFGKKNKNQGVSSLWSVNP